MTSVCVGGKSRTIKPLPRKLGINGHSLSLRKVCRHTGGIILGEGDSGKSTYAKMLVEAACANGPAILVPLRRRSIDVELPELKCGEVLTIVFDGLDEFPECARDLVDFATPLDPEFYHIWVTSRGGDAASILCESERFENIYRLDAFTEADVLKIASSVDLNGGEFLDAIDECGLSSFIEKPGGAVLLLQLFAKGRLENLSETGLFEAISDSLVCETRDGHVNPLPKGKYTNADLLDAACWLATALVISERDAIWIGPHDDCPESDLCLSDIPLAGFNRDILPELFKRRIFEPLDCYRLRISYADLPDYLTGRWLAHHLPVACLMELWLKYSEYPFANWAAEINTEFARAIDARCKQERGELAREINKIGFGKYFKRCVRGYSSDDGKEFDDLDGQNDFAQYLINDVLCRPKLAANERYVAAKLLVSCNFDFQETVRALVRAALVQYSEGRYRNLIEFVFVYCGRRRPPELELFKPIYDDDVKLADGNLERAYSCLMKFFDYPTWLIFTQKAGTLRSVDQPSAEEADCEEELEEILTERSCARSLDQDASAENLRRLIKMEKVRGLSYRAIDRYFDRLLESDAETVFDDYDILYLALRRNPERYLPRLVAFVDEDGYELAHFLDWADIKDREFLPLHTWALGEKACSKLFHLLHDMENDLRYYHVRLMSYLEPHYNPYWGDSVEPDEVKDLWDIPDRDEAVHVPPEKLEELRLLARFAEKKDEPVMARIVDVDEGVAAKIALAVKDKGGRPRKSDREAGSLSQREVAIMFGKPCKVTTVNNWERYHRTDGAAGSTPPAASFKGHPVFYSADLRLHPTDENKLILAALVTEYKSTRAVKDGIRHKFDKHFKSEETLYRAPKNL